MQGSPTFLTGPTGLALLATATEADARTNLGLAIGTNVQAYDADLAAIAALTTTGVIDRTGDGTATTRTTGTTGLSVLASANAATARTAISAAPLDSPTFTGTVTASATTASTSTTSGALVVTGGLGVGGNSFVGGQMAIPSGVTLIGSATSSGPSTANNSLVHALSVQSTTISTPQAVFKGNTSVPSGATGANIGNSQVIHWIKSIPVDGTRSRLVIPFVDQSALNQNTLVKVLAKNDRFNADFHVTGFEATFIAAHLLTVTGLNSWGLGGNISSITTSGNSVNLNFSSALTSGSVLVVYLQVMSYQNDRSVNFANILVE